ncbi:MAG: DUF348 domain-containing protein [Caldilineales bacterium]|nr:DUF348 domain-containing protein [Caldilineales bacterium]
MSTTYPATAVKGEVRQESNRRMLLVLLLVLGLLLALAVRQYFVTRIHVIVEVDGRTTSIFTHARDPQPLLQGLGLTLKPEDMLTTSSPRLSPDARLVIQRARPVRLVEGGRVRTYWTHAVTFQAFLEERQIILGEHDILSLDGQPVSVESDLPGMVWQQSELARPNKPWDYTAAPIRLEIHRAGRLLIDDNGNAPSAIYSTSSTVGEALAEAGIEVYLGDEVFPPLHSRIQPDQKVVIRRSLPVQISVDGRDLTTRTRTETVADALSEQGIVLFGQDYVTPALASALAPHTDIRITRVSEDVLYEDESVPFATVWRPDDDLPIDQRIVASAGQSGVLRSRYRVRYEDGEEVSRDLEASWQAAEPEDKVIAYGRKIVPQTLDTPDGPITYWRKMRVYANSYSPARSGTPKSAPWYGRTRLGMTLEKGVVAVDPSVINLRQQLYVPNYGLAIAGDTGGGVQGKWIDLGYDDASYRSWHWWTDIYLLWPPPPSHSIRYVLPSWPQFPDRG